MSQEDMVHDAPVVRIDRALLETWPGRFRFPDVLVRLVTKPDPDHPADDAGLARAVLSRAGGRPPRVVCEELLERGEFDAAAYVHTDCPDLSAHDKEALGRKLESARAAAGEDVRQRVGDLRRRAAAAGVTLDTLDITALAVRARSRKTAADSALNAAAAALTQHVEPITVELRASLGRQAADAAAPVGGPTAKRVEALIEAGELIAARTLLKREPLGSPIPESVAQLPAWDPRWDPDRFLVYHLNPATPRPPEFASWETADSSGKDLLTAYDRLQKEDSAEAAEAFADALNRFLGGSGRGGAARRVGTSRFHHTYFDGLFGTEFLSRLHPTGRVDLYVGGPGTTAVPDRLAEQAPHVTVAPNLAAHNYTDRQTTAVLSLRDLLRLVVLPTDRAAALLGVLARQWPVTALIGDHAADLATTLGDDTDTAWRTLRWITHLSLGTDHAVAQAMENCTAMDPALLRIMLRYAEHRMVVAGTELWSRTDGGWQRDDALAQALQEELVARCGDSATEAAWWAALAAGDPATGDVSTEDLLLLVEMCSDWPGAGNRVRAGVDALMARGLLVRAGEGADEHLKVPPSGVVRMLRAGAEHQLTGLLARLAHTQDEQDAGRVAAPNGPRPPAGWTSWERNRFAIVPALVRLTSAESGGAADGELAALTAEAEAELCDLDPAALAGAAEPSATELAPVLDALAAQCHDHYPGTILDVRCPPALRVDVPEAVLKAVLYEVLDNAARVVAGTDAGLVQVLARTESPEVLVEVQDSGPGLPAGSRGRRIFTLSAAGREQSRSGGLHRARQLLRAFATPQVESDLEAFESAHPTLTGAALRLVLPEHAR
ncbi:MULTISPECIES: ATP-binding protein [Streptomyces]|uniref:ATP-binding protein n=1 Tax=Streptomyces TaxID=1883 RepID=UPI0029BA7D9D|nr:ATP-binding protein [Streptomyces scabiei]MDX3114618.1 ATP-binding protein [Streptomyces scabiei]